MSLHKKDIEKEVNRDIIRERLLEIDEDAVVTVSYKNYDLIDTVELDIYLQENGLIFYADNLDYYISLIKQ